MIIIPLTNKITNFMLFITWFSNRLPSEHHRLHTKKKYSIFKQPLRSLNIIIMGKKLQKKEKIPSFIRKLIHILEDKKFVGIVSWLNQGFGFQILNASRFNQLVLPAYFKHKNLASFIRQLNMYGFIRPKDSNQYVYTHQRFQRGNTNALRFMKRKNTLGVQESKDAQPNQSSSQFVVSNKKINFCQLIQSLLKENQELKKLNEQLNTQINSFKKQIKLDSKSSEGKSQVVTVLEATLNKKLQFTPIQAQNEQKIFQQNPYCFGVFSNYLAYYPEVFFQNQFFAINNSRNVE